MLKVRKLILDGARNYDVVFMSGSVNVGGRVHLTQTSPQFIVIQNKQLAKQIPVHNRILIIEQNNILILCFKEDDTDSTKLLSPKGLMLKL